MVGKLLNVVHENVLALNSSKFFAGVIMIMLNIGSRYMTLKFSKSQEAYLRLLFGKQVLIFSIGWLGTRDIYTALIITAIFTVLSDFALNEDSKFCVLPERMKEMHNIIDTNNDGELSEKEIDDSIKILEKVRKIKGTKTNIKQLEMFHHMKNA